MTLNQQTKIENEINKLRNCVVIYKNCKPIAVKTIDLPVVHNGVEKTIGEVINFYEEQIKNFNNQINSLEAQIKKLHQIAVKTIEYVQKTSTINAVQIADIKEEIK